MQILKKNIPIIVSLIIAIIAGILIYTAIKSMAPSVPVVVAKDNIMVGAELNKDNLTVVQYPVIAVPKTSFSSIGALEGAIVINGPIVNGNVIRTENVTDEGSLMASLKTFAPQADWTAVELPPGGALGMINLRRGDKVDVYGEIGSGQGIIVGLVCKGAIILEKPIKDKRDQFIVAVPKEFAPAVAELIIRNKPMTVTLNNTEEVVQEAPAVETPPVGETAQEQTTQGQVTIPPAEGVE